MHNGVEIIFHESTGSVLVRDRFEPELGTCYRFYMEQQERREMSGISNIDSGPRNAPMSKGRTESVWFNRDRSRRNGGRKRRTFRDN
jgi:hypothetical protein